MLCPNCKKEIIIPNKAYLNLESYNIGGSVVVASECCNAGFIVKMNVNFKITPYTGLKNHDEWGVKLKK